MRTTRKLRVPTHENIKMIFDLSIIKNDLVKIMRSINY